MSSARHFRPADSTPDDQLKQEITADIAAARSAQRDLNAAGQTNMAGRMGAANNGTWQPRHV